VKRLLFQVLIGERRPLWEKCVRSAAAYAARIGCVHQVQLEMVLKVMPKKSQRSEGAVRLGGLPNLEKLNGLSYLHEFEQIALIDSDVYITDSAPNIFDCVPTDCDVAGVTERALPISPLYARKLDRYEQMQFAPVNGVGLPFLQCGVMVYNRSFQRFMPDGPKAFWEQPSLERFINGEGGWRWQSEQCTLSWFLRANSVNVAALPIQFNWLYGALQPGRMHEGWFHHLFLSEHLKGDDPAEMIRTGTARPRL